MSTFFRLDAGASYPIYRGRTKLEEVVMRDFLDFKPVPPLSDWQPLTLTLYESSPKPHKPGDCMHAGGILISQRAADALHDIWQKHAVLYPVFLENAEGQFYLVRAATVLDCLNHEQSEFDRYGMLRRWVFDENAVGDADFFWLNEPSLFLLHPFVSEGFKQRVKQARLKGFCFEACFGDPKAWVS